MTPKDRITSALKGLQSDRTPAMLHNFMMAAREYGVSMKQFREDPVVMAEALVRSVEKYEFDGILVDMDTVTLAGALGVPVDFPDHEPARCHLGILPELKDWRNLPAVNIEDYPYVINWLEAVRLVKRYVGDDIYVRGNCDQAPFSLAGMVRGSADWMTDLYVADEDDKIGLLEYCTEATRQFIRLMAQTGCDMISNGDSPAGPDLIPPELYKQYAFPYEKRVVEEAHNAGLPYTLHICGNTELILHEMIETGADALELDYKTDIRKIAEAFKGKVTLIGNIDPSGVLALGTPDQVRTKTRELIKIMGKFNRFILNAGCALPPNTPEGNLRAMLEEIN
ncbi:MAG: uroporphyrinogen decarboxylase family protein [Bacteroidales bacterium]|jgi:uroporphyrinogen decarboxylase